MKTYYEIHRRIKDGGLWNNCTDSPNFETDKQAKEYVTFKTNDSEEYRAVKVTMTII